MTNLVRSCYDVYADPPDWDYLLRKSFQELSDRTVSKYMHTRRGTNSSSDISSDSEASNLKFNAVKIVFFFDFQVVS